MAKGSVWFYLSVIVISTILVSEASAYTDLLDVEALQGLYTALNSPPQLKGWKSDGGDPCDESWTGISCSGSSVLHIEINGLELNGTLGFQLSDLRNLKQLDVSSNKLHGEIPNSLPLNGTHINLAYNHFRASIPQSLTSLKNLRHLNLSHNSLSGPIGNVFTNSQNLREMDLSYNNFSGDLPSSFGSLTNLTRLFLQSNKFTGSVIYLVNVPLTDLNIQDNNFSGVIPSKFESIHNLWIGGNRFQVGENYPPWKFPLDNLPSVQNISSPPTTESSAIAKSPSHTVKGQMKKRLGPGGIAFMVCGGTLVASCAALILGIRILQSRARKLESMGLSDRLEDSLQLSTAGEESPHILPIRTRVEKMTRRRSFSKKCSIPMSSKMYTLVELQSATNGFCKENLLGEGSLGSVYRAELPDGQFVAVKNVNTVQLSLKEQDQFMDVIFLVARLKHPNIVPLLGYSVEQGQHLLVYEYIRSLSLDDALHREGYMPLSWGLRLQIALGIAQALNYLHSTCSPPVAHSNLKAANILLDEELMPRICDSGLAVLRPLTSNSVKVKASEMAIGDAGYIEPEHFQHGVDSTKGDVYAFGVLLLELLTGRRPFDSLRPSEELSLVKWASSRLHGNKALEQMVDPSIRRSLSTKALSRFADIVTLCIQPEKELRAPMSEIVQHLTNLLQRARTRKSIRSKGAEADARSFSSTYTRFFSSPAVSNTSSFCPQQQQ